MHCSATYAELNPNSDYGRYKQTRLPAQNALHGWKGPMGSTRQTA
jgi:hypothetical protein